MQKRARRVQITVHKKTRLSTYICSLNFYYFRVIQKIISTQFFDKTSIERILIFFFLHKIITFVFVKFNF